MWYVAIEDETGCEVEVDYCFGTREDALRDGEKLKKDILEALAAKQKIRDRFPVDFENTNPVATIFWGINEMGGT